MPARETRIEWQRATVERVAVETPRVKTFTIRLSRWTPFLPGQHFDVRLTAPDGYRAERSYSVASAPERKGAIDLTIELVPGGEVSAFFHEVIRPGDALEARGPIGGPFTWTAAQGGPLLLIGGGSGIVPLMSMLRHRVMAGSDVPALLLYSARTWESVIYRQELETMNAADPNLTVLYTLTRAAPPGWSGYRGRLDATMAARALRRVGHPRYVYVCGARAFVESATRALLSAGVPPHAVRLEAFGPTGGPQDMRG